MAELVTLDALYPADPAAADHSSGANTGQGPSDASGANSPPPGPDVTARIAELEGLVNRHRQQWTGLQQETTRLRTELDAVRNTPPPVAPPPTPPLPARVGLREAMEQFVLNSDPSLLATYDAQQASQPRLTTDDVARVMKQTTEELRTETQAAQAASTVNLSLQQALAARHPELADMGNHAAFATATAQRYQQLLNDPVTALSYAPNPAAMYTDPTTGAEYDMRILMSAADYTKVAQPTTPVPRPPSLGVTVSGSAPVPSDPVVPRHLARGPAAVLLDPQIQAELANIGWGASPREQMQALLKYTPEATKQRWQRGEV